MKAIFYKNWIKMGATSVLILIAGGAWPQSQISGKIIDSATATPLADASVYIANSTLGTKTDKSGEYSFPNITPGNHEIIASCIGYQARQASIVAKTGNNVVDLVLSTRSIELKEVTVSAKNDWKHNLYLFKKEFIGTSNTQECNILNPEILNLDFDYKKNRLSASTDDFLEIENRTLGYKLRFLVKDFWADYNSGKCHYSGSVIFEELKGKKSDQKRWEKNRQNTYNGSFRHFLASLCAGKLSSNKFVVKTLTRIPNPKRPTDSLIKQKNKFFTALMNKGDKNAQDSVEKWVNTYKLPKLSQELSKTALSEVDLVKLPAQQEVYKLQFSGTIYVIYKNKSVDIDNDDLFRFKEASDHQISSVTLKNSAKPTLFNSKGELLTNESLLFEGAWDSRIIDLLPSDYMPAEK